MQKYLRQRDVAKILGITKPQLIRLLETNRIAGAFLVPGKTNDWRIPDNFSVLPEPKPIMPSRKTKLTPEKLAEMSISMP